ncbi:Histone-lysine N-methyltransferase SETMAR [Habropoda laboriosa]|uniref:Histone-lysine N-methyltransferase SETMAR n=1 Tax=Habropoda laboriosa TaxID=597456 RepID=A0A0L7QPE7_9HYME|nr:Histone-lysine N-methyltransferase SETMAR [Habropoda laboriosa]
MQCQKLKDVRWEVLPHPPYSPDYHLFLPMSNFFANRNVKNDVEVKTATNSFLESKTQEFYKKGMYKIIERWKRVVELNGDYFIQ